MLPLPTKEQILVKDHDGKSVMVPAYYTYDKEGVDILQPSSAFRQPKKGNKVHGGHCNTCSAELTPFTKESYRGVCDNCTKIEESDALAEGREPRWTL